MISGDKIYAKNSITFAKIKLRQNAFIYKSYTKIHNFYKIPLKIPFKYTIRTQRFLFYFISFNFKQKYSENATKKYSQQNTVCLEQQIYASQKKITQPLVVMVETFRRSAV